MHNISINNTFKKFLYTLIIYAFLFSSFAQTTKQKICKNAPKELWRELADSGKYHDAIQILSDSIQKSTQKHNKSIYWHIGQLYACNNDYANAIIFIRKSSGFFDRIFDREWRWYYSGTIAFLQKDKRKLKICADKLWNTHSGYYYMNACKLKALLENFDKPYKFVYEMTCE